MNGYCISDKYCQYKSDTGYCGYTAGCILDNSRTVEVPISQKWVTTQVVDISTDSIEAIADAVVKKMKGDDELPSAQPEWYTADDGSRYCYCMETSDCRMEDFYCADAERRTDD